VDTDLDPSVAYAACAARDTRWDGRVYLGVTSTGVYCRPSCPARMPRPENCRFFVTAASAATAGFRACRRCRPDALPGHRDLDASTQLVDRALRAIRDGVVDEVGVDGLAARLGVTPRHLHRLVVGELGTSPVRLARTRRAQAARMLLEQTTLPVADVAFAAGFGSIRQCNEVLRAELGASPVEIRARASRGGQAEADIEGRRPAAGVQVALRLPVRRPFDGPRLADAVAVHAIAGVEMAGRGSAAGEAWARATLPAPGGTAFVGVDLAELGPATAGASSGPWAGDRAAVSVQVRVASLAVRRWLDLDADPGAVAERLRPDARLAPLLDRRPGLRVLGSLDPFRTLTAAILGQQISLAATRTFTSRLAGAFGEPTPIAEGALAFPGPDRLAEAGPEAIRAALRIPAARARTLHAAAEAVAGGLDLGPGADRDAIRSALLGVTGIGPWTCDLMSIRALGDPDALPPGDLVLRRALEGPAGRPSPADVVALAEAWRPWRAYATTHLWTDDLESR
jgi:AraC family transcriptional regulator of adaptative response / DNA-3-methyladenine glycosylase II